MLILTRYPNESIILTTPAGRVEITLMDVRRDGRVRLGIEAPRSITVHRKEIQAKIDQEKGVTNGVVTNMPG